MLYQNQGATQKTLNNLTLSSPTLRQPSFSLLKQKESSPPSNLCSLFLLPSATTSPSLQTNTVPVSSLSQPLFSLPLPHNIEAALPFLLSTAPLPQPKDKTTETIHSLMSDHSRRPNTAAAPLSSSFPSTGPQIQLHFQPKSLIKLDLPPFGLQQ